jgi:predicted flap endonuclease-1-like 5' DNA nuclease
MTPGTARAMTLVAAVLLARVLADAKPPGREEERAAPHAGGARLLYGEKLDPNREPPEVLALLPGIGPARAAAIVAARPHCALADLDRVAGIGPVTLRTLAQHVAFHDLPRDCERELQAIGH